MKKVFTITLLILFLAFVVALENTFSYSVSKRVYELRKERDSLERVVADLRGETSRLRTASNVESLARSMGMRYVWEIGNVEIETLKIHVRPMDNPDSLLVVLLSGVKKDQAKSQVHIENIDSSQKR